MAANLRNLTATARRYGWAEALRVAGLWLLRQVAGYRHAVIYRLDLDQLNSAGDSRIIWTFAVPSLEGDGGFSGTVAGRPCYSSTVSVNGFSIANRFSVLFAGQEDFYTGDCVTEESFRGHGIYPRALVELGTRVRERGGRALYLFVERENTASIHGVLKAGFRPVASCSVMERGAWSRRWWHTKPEARGWLAEWTIEPAARPESQSGPGPRPLVAGQGSVQQGGKLSKKFGSGGRL